MPTYDATCANGHKWEVFQTIYDVTNPKCPKCGSEGKREIGAGVGVLMKNRGPVSDKIADGFKAGAAKKKLEKMEADVDERARNLGHEVP